MLHLLVQQTGFNRVVGALVSDDARALEAPATTGMDRIPESDVVVRMTKVRVILRAGGQPDRYRRPTLDRRPGYVELQHSRVQGLDGNRVRALAQLHGVGLAYLRACGPDTARRLVQLHLICCWRHIGRNAVDIKTSLATWRASTRVHACRWVERSEGNARVFTRVGGWSDRRGKGVPVVGLGRGGVT